MFTMYGIIGVGCGPAKSASVAVPYRTAEITIPVESSRTDNCDLGIKSMEVGNWDGAIGFLERAVQDDTQDYKAHFALGVCYEIKGEYKKSLYQYNAAIKWSSSLYSQSITRVRKRLNMD